MRKAINFDLNVELLKKYYPKYYTNAYKELEQFFIKEGFIHRQWSGYVSDRDVSKVDLMDIIERLSETFPWLRICVKEIDVTDVGETYTLKPLIDTVPLPIAEKQIKKLKKTKSRRL